MAKILVCDNEEDTVVLIESLLKGEGFEVVKAFSGEDALEVWEREKPDLILLDIMMPGLSGWDVYWKIRKKDKEQKVIFISVLEVLDERKENLKKEGVTDYILKPFNTDDLVKRVKAALE